MDGDMSEPNEPIGGTAFSDMGLDPEQIYRCIVISAADDDIICATVGQFMSALEYYFGYNEGGTPLNELGFELDDFAIKHFSGAELLRMPDFEE